MSFSENARNVSRMLKSRPRINQMTYIFYDLETTGTDKNFDQILQFAAILTDDDFRELDRFEVRCRLITRQYVRLQTNYDLGRPRSSLDIIR